MSQNPFEHLQEMIKDMSSKVTGSMDRESMMLSHRKNMEALTEANRMAVEVMKSIAQLQSHYVKQTFADIASIFKDMTTTAPLSKEALTKHTDYIKHSTEKATVHGSTIASAIAKSQKEIFDLMHRRYSEGVGEMIDLRETTTVPQGRTKH
jgi:phasin family protein